MHPFTTKQDAYSQPAITCSKFTIETIKQSVKYDETLEFFSGYWVTGPGCYIEKNLELSRSPLNCSKDSWKLLTMFVSLNWPSFVTYWVVVQKILSKMHPFSCTAIHQGVTKLVNHGIIKNTKTWISWEGNIHFLRNNLYNILNLWLRWRIYEFIVL